MFARCRCGDCVVPGGAHEHGCIQLHLSSALYCHEGSSAGFVWRHQVHRQSTFSCYSHRLPVGSCTGAVRAGKEGTAAGADQVPLMGMQIFTLLLLSTNYREITWPWHACLQEARHTRTCILKVLHIFFSFSILRLLCFFWEIIMKTWSSVKPMSFIRLCFHSGFLLCWCFLSRVRSK